MTQINSQQPSQPPTGEPRGSNTTSWVLAAAVAVVAIIAIVVITRNQIARPSPTEVARAIEQSRAEGMMAGAKSTMDSARQVAANTPPTSAARTAEGAAQDAVDMRDAADRSAANAEAAATNAADTLGPAPGESAPEQRPPQ